MHKVAAGIVLNGGRSFRMGTDKGQLVYRGKSLLQYSLDLIAPFCERVYVSGPSPLKSYDTLQDLFPGCGPMGGIAGALQSLSPTSPLLFVPVDMPFLSPDTISKLVSASAERSAVLVDQKNGPIPVVACYTQTVFPAMNAALVKGDYSLQRFLSQIDFTTVSASDPRECLNINSSEDFRLISEL